MKSAYSVARARRLRQRSDPKTAGEHGALRQRSRRSGVKERGFPKGENSRGGSPLWFPPLVFHIRKRNEKLYLKGNISKSDK